VGQEPASTWPNSCCRRGRDAANLRPSVFRPVSALTRHRFGQGTFTYQGTVLSGELQQAVLREVMQLAGLESQDWSLPAPVQVRHGVKRAGPRRALLSELLGRAAGVHIPVRGRARAAEGDAVATDAEGRAGAVGAWRSSKKGLGRTRPAATDHARSGRSVTHVVGKKLLPCDGSYRRSRIEISTEWNQAKVEQPTVLWPESPNCSSSDDPFAWDPESSANCRI